ncbi:MAG TPA: hypothetical protein VN641_15590, partial [Urbifossiella sp.]|nr:hypothetical protein [Urbifossiella sp.]
FSAVKSEARRFSLGEKRRRRAQSFGILRKALQDPATPFDSACSTSFNDEKEVGTMWPEFKDAEKNLN